MHVAGNASVDPAPGGQRAHISCTEEAALEGKADGTRVCEVRSAGGAEVAAGSAACAASRS